jgi:hypothetical protein
MRGRMRAVPLKSEANPSLEHQGAPHMSTEGRRFGATAGAHLQPNAGAHLSGTLYISTGYPFLGPPRRQRQLIL